MAESITGLYAATIRGLPSHQVFATNTQLLQILETSRQHQTPLTAPRLEFQRADGEYVPLAVRTAMLHDNAAYVVGLLVIFDDLSPIQTLERQLHRADRLAALGQMAAGVAHEIKNPLASIRTFVQLLQRKYHDQRFLEKFNRIVPQELGRINFIVEEMLALAKPTQLHARPTSLPALLQRVVDVYAERMQHQHIRLKTNFTATLPPLVADEEQLYRCFTNLVLNAIEAMSEQGELTITCQPVPKALVDFAAFGGGNALSDLTKTASLSLDLYTTDIEVVVKDTGMGIPADQLDTVFTPFWTTKPKGTGLGLALVHKIIEDHRGSVQITSEVGHGTAVTVLLPSSATTNASSA